MRPWYQLRAKEVSQKLNVDLATGLSSVEARKRLAQYGFNRLVEKKPKSFILIFFEQLRNFLILVLIAAALISGALNEWNDVLVILTIVFLNCLLGAIQQVRAERAIAALKKLSLPKVTVLREGFYQKILVTELVPGDIVLLEVGGYVPADLRLIEAVNLRIDESALTGESVPSEKQSEELTEENLPLAEQKNMVFSGTIVSYGRGKGIVVATGMQTELGKIAKLIIEEKKEKSPLEKKFDQFGHWLGALVIAICIFIFVVGFLFLRIGLGEIFLTSVSLAVAAIPEGLPAVVVISLALGAHRLAKKRAIMRKLPAVETLGSVTVICSDKTGTMTENRMQVQEVEVFSGGDLLWKGAALCNDATLTIGDPTEIALLLAAQKEGLEKEKLEKDYPRISEIPFDAKTKRMTTLHQEIKTGSYLAFTKGALEVILELSDNLTKEEKAGILRKAEELAQKGRRILALAYRKYDFLPKEIEEKNLLYLGYLAMIDPLRAEVKPAVSKCRQAGILPIMITGDHRLTALAMAKEAGVCSDESEVIEGKDLEGKDLTRYRVFARVSPEHKLRIVEAFKSRGEIVAMTGDGVNDAPALKRADIGVAMGIAGTDVAKEASDMILTDDNFATIVEAVEEGRGIYDNIVKFVHYMLTTNSGEVLTMFFSIILRLPLPLLPIQILWVNLVTDGLPALALTAEPIEEDVMKRPPRNPDETVASRELLGGMIGIGILMAGVTLFLFGLGMRSSLEKARTMAFSALALLQMAHVLNCKSLSKSLFEIGLFSNWYLVGAVISTLIFQILVVQVSFLQRIFYTTSLTGREWLLVGLLSLTPTLVVEIRKRLFR